MIYTKTPSGINICCQFVWTKVNTIKDVVLHVSNTEKKFRVSREKTTEVFMILSLPSSGQDLNLFDALVF